MPTFTWTLTGSATSSAASVASSARSHLSTTADYGIDCTTWAGADQELPDLDPTFQLMSPYDVRTVAESCGRRLCMEQGEHIESPNDGFNLRAQLNRKLDNRRLFEIKVSAERECMKDERVSSAKASIHWNPRTKKISVPITIETTDGQNFELVVKEDYSTKVTG